MLEEKLVRINLTSTGSAISCSLEDLWDIFFSLIFFNEGCIKLPYVGIQNPGNQKLPGSNKGLNIFSVF